MKGDWQSARLGKPAPDKENAIIKKRYIALGLIALDLVCLPVTAHVLGKVSFSAAAPPHAISTELPRRVAGVSNLIVTSNTPFYLTAENITGKVDISIRETRALGSASPTENAQYFIPKNACALPLSSAPSVIYADQPIAANPDGETPNRSVILTLHYAPGTDPIFKVIAEKEANDIDDASACEPGQS